MDSLGVTWSTVYIDPGSGRECTIAIGNGDGKEVLAKAADILAWLDRTGAQPVLTGAGATSARESASAPMLPLGEGEERLLITRIKRDGSRADIYARGHRYPTTKLFDLGLLIPVGLNVDALPDGVEAPCYFYVVVTEGEKKNKAGNPYKNVVRVEAAL